MAKTLLRRAGPSSQGRAQLRYSADCTHLAHAASRISTTKHVTNAASAVSICSILLAWLQTTA